MRKSITILFIAALTLVLAACSGSRTEDGTKSTTTTSKTDSKRGSGSGKDIAAKKRPKTKTGTISLEGMSEEFTFTLVDSPELEFSTYIASDMVADSASSSEGGSLFIFAKFGGKLNKDARLFFFSRPKAAQISIEEMTELAKETIRVEGFEIRERKADIKENRYAFSETEFDVSKQKKDGTNILGTVSIFTHGKRAYWAIVEYPEEFEEGFGPRVDKVFDDIVWYDDKKAD